MNSINGNNDIDSLLIDEDYIGYHKDRPKPDQLAERRLRMSANNSVL